MGLAAAGVGPAMAVGFTALISLVVIRCMVKSATRKRKEFSMKPAKTFLRLLVLSTLSTIWAVGTSAVPSASAHN